MSDMLKQVQELKQEAVEAMMSGTKPISQVHQKMDAFLTSNRYAILDMLDDALSKYEGVE
jgi:hypothetical protein